MAGNVAEWTGSSYDPGAYEYVSSLKSKPFSLKDEKRKVVRGGSWKDVAYFLRVSSRDYEYAMILQGVTSGLELFKII